MLAIDDESFKPGTEHVLRQAVDRLIAGLSPRDRVSLVTMPYGGVKVPADDRSHPAPHGALDGGGHAA